MKKILGPEIICFWRKKLGQKNVWVKKDWGWGESEITAKLSQAGAGAWAKPGNKC